LSAIRATAVVDCTVAVEVLSIVTARWSMRSETAVIEASISVVEAAAVDTPMNS
jgi:hypothetical protein